MSDDRLVSIQFYLLLRLRVYQSIISLKQIQERPRISMRINRR